jgi:hypothetical protein
MSEGDEIGHRDLSRFPNAPFLYLAVHSSPDPPDGVGRGCSPQRLTTRLGP